MDRLGKSREKWGDLWFQLRIGLGNLGKGGEIYGFSYELAWEIEGKVGRFMVSVTDWLGKSRERWGDLGFQLRIGLGNRGKSGEIYGFSYGLAWEIEGKVGRFMVSVIHWFKKSREKWGI